MLLADRAYVADWIRVLADERGAWANIPPRRNRKEPICYSAYLYRARNLVEWFSYKKPCRRVATRCDKLAANCLAFIQLASIRLWLRAELIPCLRQTSALAMPRSCSARTAMIFSSVNLDFLMSVSFLMDSRFKCGINRGSGHSGLLGLA